MAQRDEEYSYSYSYSYYSEEEEPVEKQPPCTDNNILPEEQTQEQIQWEEPLSPEIHMSDWEGDKI